MRTSSLPENEPEVWAAIGPDSLLEALGPLAAEHGRRGATVLLSDTACDIETFAASLGTSRATLLVVEDPNQASSRWRYDEPFLKTAGGGDVLLGWACL